MSTESEMLTFPRYNLLVIVGLAQLLILTTVFAGESPAEETERQTPEELSAILEELNEGLPKKVHDRLRADSVTYVESTLVYNYTVFKNIDSTDDPHDFSEIEPLVREGIDYVTADKCSDPEWIAYFESGGTFKLLFLSDLADSIAQFVIGIDDCKTREQPSA